MTYANQGSVATDDIEEDEELFSIPYDAVICQANISWPVDNPNLRAEVESLEPFFGLVVSLMFEHAKGSASRWHRYFAILPTQFDTLMYWSESELKELEGSAVLKKINREAADRTFLEVLMPMVARNSTWFAEAGRWADTSNREYSQEKFIALAHRMANLIMGYAFDLEQKSDMDAGESKDLDMDEVVVLAQGMVPLADMLNADGENANVFIINLCRFELC
jgi:SET domain-containing protein 6